ncbi:hypothetical protein [Paraburkholderia bryophila]|uniref:hypothetical protein n=1 Tax=Paraburkholderia bryophila TaxID=420952 RepID=UPI0011BDAE63|nr:hypothetical protein [Paraburkholderia bryophila]
MSSVPGWMAPHAASAVGLGPGVTTTGRGIDVFQNYNARHAPGTYTALDMSRPFTVTHPTTQGPLGQTLPFAPLSQPRRAPNAPANANGTITNRRTNRGGEAFDIIF